MPTGLRILTAGVPNQALDFHSGEVDFVTMDWTRRLSAESVSASGVSAFINWYLPAGMTGFLSGTAVGASGIWVKMSATAAPGTNTAYMCSARVTTTSAKSLFETFTVRVWTGVA